MSSVGDSRRASKGWEKDWEIKFPPKAGEPGRGGQVPVRGVNCRDARRAAGVAAGHAQRSDGGGVTV